MEKTYNFEPLKDKKWAIILTSSNKDQIKKMSIGKEYNYDAFNYGKYYHFIGKERFRSKDGQPGSADEKLNPEFQLLTLEQLKSMIEPTIIGWKLKEEALKYAKAAASIIGNGWWSENADNNLKGSGWNFGACEDSNSCEQLLKKAGVLEQWFEPVYKQEKITSYKVGDYLFCKKDFAMDSDPKDVRYKEGKVYLSENKRCLTDEIGNANHVMGPEGTYGINGGEFNDYFRFATEEEIKTYRKTTVTFSIGSNLTRVVVTNSKIKAGSEIVDVYEVYQAYKMFKSFNVGPWTTSIPYIQIGCGQFSREELKLVIEAYNEISGTTFIL